LLSGTGTAVPVPGIDITPTSLTFAARTINTTSAAQNVTITNTGFANLNFDSITVGASFSRVALGANASPGDCGSSLAPGSSCQIAVVFGPLGTGAVNAQILIADNAAGSPHTVALSGTGTPVPVAVMATSGALAFGDQIINTTSASKSLTLSNTGTATLTTSAITLTGANAGNFTLTGQSGCASIAPAGSCTLSLTFKPTATGASAAQVSITSNAQNAATVNAVPLSGNGILGPRSVATLTATVIGFGDAIFGGATANQIVRITNTGGQALTFASIVAVGDFVQNNDCGTSLLPLASCTINVSFTPLATGARFGELVLTTNAPSSPDKVQLSGTSCRWFSQAQSRFFLTSCGN
jgi:archaellum component FlaF (FlaF/FlaG flagellin family)